jgi:hypothetical protein
MAFADAAAMGRNDETNIADTPDIADTQDVCTQHLQAWWKFTERAGARTRAWRSA